MVAERPKLANEPQKEEEGEVAAKVTERKARGETGEGSIDVLEATRGVECEGEERGNKKEREMRSCSACCLWMEGGRAREGKL